MFFGVGGLYMKCGLKGIKFKIFHLWTNWLSNKDLGNKSRCVCLSCDMCRCRVDLMVNGEDRTQVWDLVVRRSGGRVRSRVIHANMWRRRTT